MTFHPADDRLLNDLDFQDAWLIELAKEFAAAESVLDELALARRSLRLEVMQLRQLPCYESASIRFKARQYAYLKHWRSGHRLVEYVGCDASRIADAQAGIDRGIEVVRLKLEIDQIDRSAKELLNRMHSLVLGNRHSSPEENPEN